MEYSASNIAPIALLPFFAFVLNSLVIKPLFKNKWENIAVGISCLSIFGSFLYASRIFLDFIGTFSSEKYVSQAFTWIDLGPFKVDMGFYIDNMTAIMLLMVTGVATLIHIFSTYYMKGDEGGFGRFFVYVSLFTSAMLGLVLANNLLMIFIFWELMGFCSYSLIGFYNKKEASGNASLKAFMTTRVGDVFFLLGILAIWQVVGSVNITDIYAAIGDGKFNGIVGPFGMGLATFAAICIFAGTIGKSAQFPLQVWLPDAMKGPTPCSALIHAATMVAAGVYLSLRMYPLMEAGEITYFISLIGAITAFGAATIALVQTDFKAVLAYSTISQLGYMVMGIGVGAYNPAFMHLITHAVFKACLFLSAGSVIHTLHAQEMPRMGGLRKKLPFTFIAMACCTLAIIGMPLWAGFVSKDRILGDALFYGFMAGDSSWYKMLIPILGFAGAGLTTFYMCRMMFLAFFGEPRDKELYDHAHKEKLSWNQNVPLLILSVFTFGYFFSGSPTGLGAIKGMGEKYEWFKTLVVKPDVSNFSNVKTVKMSWSEDLKGPMSFSKSKYTGVYSSDPKVDHAIHHAHSLSAKISVVIVFFGILLAYLMYIKKSLNPAIFVNMFSRWYRALQNKYYMDHLYIDILIKKLLLGLNSFLAKIDMDYFDKYFVDGWAGVNRRAFKISGWFDNKVVDGLVDLNGAVAKGGGMILKAFQTGKIQFYFVMLIIVLSGYLLSL